MDKICFNSVKILLLWSILLTVDLTTAFTSGGFCSTPHSQPPTEVSITCLLPLHLGGSCSIAQSGNEQVIEAAKWTASKLNQLKYIPQTTIGVNIWDTCGSEESSLSAAVEAVVMGGYLEPPQCQESPHAGVVMSNQNTEAAKEFFEDVGVPYVTIDPPDLSVQMGAVSQLLKALNWTHIGAVASSLQSLKAFSSASAEHSVCVTREILIPHDYSKTGVYTEVLEELSSSSTKGAVLIGSQEEIREILSTTADIYPEMDWLLVPTGAVDITLFREYESITKGIVMVKKQSQDLPDFKTYFQKALYTQNQDSLLQRYNDDQYSEHPKVTKVAESIVSIASALRRSILNHCPSGMWCPGVNVSQALLSPEDDPSISNIGVNAQTLKFQVIRLLPNSDNILDYKTVGYISRGSMVLDMSLITMGNLSHPSQHICSFCTCSNIRFAMLSSLKWRADVWVTVSATLALIGLLVSLCICCFLSSRACSGKAQEGSQVFTILLVVASMVLYLALLPYSFQASELTCFLRPFITGVAYALVFSIMVARSLMLATADSEGLVGHVSGVVQCALFFFMMIVQIGLALQQVLLQGSPVYSLKNSGQYDPSSSLYTCNDDRIAFLLSLSYVIFLLLLQMLLAPFIIKSRRNYHEGLLFFCATLLMAAIWGAWTTLYVLLSPNWSDACVCLGLAITPTSLIISVFIPKTYLMVKARAIESVPPTVYSISRPQSMNELMSSRPPSMALYDSINPIPEINYSSPNMYSSREPSLVFKQSGYYEACNPYTPSPRKITMF